MVEKLPQYMRNRMKAPLDVDKTLLRRIDAMHKYLVQELNIRSQSAKHGMLLKLYVGLTYSLEAKYVLGALWGTFPH